MFVADAPAGIRRPDGSFFRATDPLSLIASQNLVNPNIPALAGEVVSPRLEQPATSQVSLGWAREIDPLTWVSADYVRVDGRDLNLRLRPNAIVAGRRYLGRAHTTQLDQLSHSHQQGQQPIRRTHPGCPAPRDERLDLNAWYAGQSDERRRHRIR